MNCWGFIEETREIYNIISEYVIHPNVLKVSIGILVAESACCLYGIGKIIVETNKAVKNLEGKLNK